MTQKMRKEKDLLGEVLIPENVYWGINTQRTLEHFKISGKTFPREFLFALATVKKACLQANEKLQLNPSQKQKQSTKF
ncbi:MAG: hypothetical protein ACTSV6_06830 [Candidatus Heimdallarchaeota archaeon]